MVEAVYFKAVQLFTHNAQAPEPLSNRFETTSWIVIIMEVEVVYLSQLRNRFSAFTRKRFSLKRFAKRFKG